MTDDATTIRVTRDVRDRLEDRKEADESMNTVVDRLLEDGGTLWTEDQIRKIARSEIEAAQSQY